MISTTSPLCDVLASSWAWQTVRRLQHLAVLGMGHEPLDDDPSRLAHLVGRHDPDLRLAAAAGWRRLVTGRACLAHREFSRDSIIGMIGRATAASKRRDIHVASGVAARVDSSSFDLAQSQDRLDAGDLALGLDDLAGGLEPLGLALKTEPEQVVLDFLEQQIELLVGLFAKFGWAWTSLWSP